MYLFHLCSENKGSDLHFVFTNAKDIISHDMAHIEQSFILATMFTGQSLWLSVHFLPLTLKAPNTTIAEFANTADPDETAHNEPSHLDLQCLPSKV